MSTGGLTYVDEFSFPADQGFTGSAGKSSVKGYMRGGRVKGSKTVGVTTQNSPQMKGKGTQKSAAKKSVKMMGGGSVHDQLYQAGAEMGYSRGGKVKNTSAEFVQQSKAQDPMDRGTFPPQSNNQAEKEAGGRKALKPKFKKGGKVHSVRSKGYKKGGEVSPPTVGHLGSGAAAKAAAGMRSREDRIKSTVNEALAAQKASMSSGTRTHDQPPKRAAVAKTRAPAPGSQRGKRGHYGLPFEDSPVKKQGAGR